MEQQTAGSHQRQGQRGMEPGIASFPRALGPHGVRGQLRLPSPRGLAAMLTAVPTG